MATFNHLKTLRQAAKLSFNGVELGYTARGIRVRMTPKIHIQFGEEGGVHPLNAYWGGMDIRVITTLLHVYGDADVKAAAFSSLTQIPDETNLPVGTRIDTSAFSKTLLIEPKVLPGKKITVTKAFGIINGEIALELRGDLYYPVHFFCWVRESDTFKIEDV